MGLLRQAISTARLSAVFLILFACAGVAQAEPLVCGVCGQLIHGNYYYTEDRVEHKQKNICRICHTLEARCSLCDLPVPENSKKLPDGRHFCARDLKNIVESETEAKAICKTVKYDLDRLLSRFLTMPGDDIQLSIVDKYHLENLFHAPGNESSCVSIYGATSTHPVAGNKFVHTVDLLSCMQKPHLMAVCAHEYTHAWMGENVSSARKASLDKNMVEAFCELVAYKYMESLREEHEIDAIKRNNYTVGKILVLIEADKKYGFATVMDWIKNGEDSSFEITNLDRVRAMKDHHMVAQAASSSGLVYATANVPTPVPDTLVLKGISGSGQRRFALINNATLETMEKGKVRMGQTTVSVKCLEIGKDFVTIQVDGSPEKKQLFMRVTQ